MSDYREVGCALAVIAVLVCAILIAIGIAIGWLLFGGGA